MQGGAKSSEQQPTNLKQLKKEINKFIEDLNLKEKYHSRICLDFLEHHGITHPDDFDDYVTFKEARQEQTKKLLNDAKRYFCITNRVLTVHIKSLFAINDRCQKLDKQKLNKILGDKELQSTLLELIKQQVSLKKQLEKLEDNFERCLQGRNSLEEFIKYRNEDFPFERKKTSEIKEEAENTIATIGNVKASLEEIETQLSNYSGFENESKLLYDYHEQLQSIEETYKELSQLVDILGPLGKILNNGKKQSDYRNVWELDFKPDSLSAITDKLAEFNLKKEKESSETHTPSGQSPAASSDDDWDGLSSGELEAWAEKTVVQKKKELSSSRQVINQYKGTRCSKSTDKELSVSKQKEKIRPTHRKANSK